MKKLSEKYVPLYRKYRPASFNEVVGQEVIVKTLGNAVSLNKIAHAYLFCGPRGTGKTSIARIFAKTLNCLNLKDTTPCGKCAHCLDMQNSISLDVIEIDAASNRKVEDARNLLEKVQFSPVLGKRKIYIIDEVHMLTTEAFNTLLKTLEEPPENLVFILATTESHKVLETIVSRCQKFDFKRITPKDIVNRLEEISKKENINIKKEALEFIARKSAGGLRDAIALLDQSSILAQEDQPVTKENISTLLGSISDDDLFETASIIAKKDAQSMLKYIKNILDKGNDPNQILKELTGYFRNLMLLSVCKTPDEGAAITELSEDICQKLMRQSKDFSTVEITQIIEKLSEHEKNLRNSTNPYVWLDVALISIASREDMTNLKNLTERIENLENNKTLISPQVTNKEPVIAKVRELPKVEEIKPPEITKPREIKEEPKSEPAENISMPDKEEIPTPEPEQEIDWQIFLNKVQTINMAVFALLRTHAKAISLNSKKIELAFKNDVFISKTKNKQQVLEATAKELFGTCPLINLRLLRDDDFKKKTVTEKAYTEESPITPANSTVAEKPGDTVEENEIAEELELTKTKIKAISVGNPEISDQTQSILELFSGKIIE
ncbi:MAG: DNA polymerase III subunit gamma/tau [Candidatus Gastranaerophilales bacterium]|nr:DNA polymerase III subunit gamma/tau [Candidatus Gastranaerophilales bacterium]